MLTPTTTTLILLDLGHGWTLKRYPGRWYTLISPDKWERGLPDNLGEMLHALADRVAALEAQAAADDGNDVTGPYASQRKRLAAQLGRPPEEVIAELRGLVGEAYNELFNLNSSLPGLCHWCKADDYSGDDILHLDDCIIMRMRKAVAPRPEVR